MPMAKALLILEKTNGRVAGAMATRLNRGSNMRVRLLPCLRRGRVSPQDLPEELTEARPICLPGELLSPLSGPHTHFSAQFRALVEHQDLPFESRDIPDRNDKPIDPIA